MVDLHMHSTASDGSLAPAQLLELLKEGGCTTFALTDHDTVRGAAEMARLVPEGMRYIPGCEFSCRCGRDKCHILGLGLDLEHPALLDAVRHGQQLRRDKNMRRIERLKKNFGISFSEQEINSLGSLSTAGKPHLARLLMARGLADNVGEAIDTYFAVSDGSDRISSYEAIDAITACGGIPVWAHPLGGEREKRLTGEEFRRMLDTLMSQGILGLECWYSRYGSDEVELLLSEARSRGLLVSGGSDFHGPSKPDLPVGKLNSFGREVTEEDLTVLTRL